MILSAFWKHPNIMGNNQSLTIGSEWTRYFSTGGGDIVEPSLVYEEPYVASTKWKGRFTLSYLYFSLPGLDERGYGGEIAISRFLAEKLKLTLSYSLSRNKYNETGVGGGEEEFDWTTTSRISAGIQHDTRDAVLDPGTAISSACREACPADSSAEGASIGSRVRRESSSPSYGTSSSPGGYAAASSVPTEKTRR